MILRALGVWLGLLVGAIGNGGVREALLAPNMSELHAHQLSCVSLSVIIAGITFATIGWIGARSTGRLVGLGALWVALTVAFETAFGRLGRGLSWESLLADYDVFGGRLFLLCLLTALVAPLVSARARGLNRRP